jgi:hypothetical protein
MKLYLRILFFFLLASQICSAQWVQTGPNGGFVRGITVSGSTVYAATYGGALVSTDKGIDWSHTNWGLIDGNVNAVVATSTTVYAGTQDHGVYVKDLNGLIWSQTVNALSSQRVQCMATIGNNVFAGTYSTGVYLSTNNGTTWTQMKTGMTDLQVECLAVIGTNLFAGTNSKVFLSTNMGTSWTSASTGLPNNDIITLAVNGTSIYAGVWANGAWVSTNNGVGWMLYGTGSPANYPYSFAFNGTNVYVCGGNVYRTTNDGNDWTDVTGDIPSGAQILSLAYLNGNLIAGDNAVNNATGMYVSTNNGTNWTSINWGLPNYCATSITARNGKLLTGTCGGVFLSTDAGVNWNEPTLHGDNNWADFTALAYRNNNYVFAGDINGNAYVSTNAGQDFTLTTQLEQGALISSFAFSGTNIFASTNAWASGSPNAVFLSGDNGATWTKVNTGLPTTSYIPSLAVIGTNLFAATGTGVYLSTNNGTSWTSVSNGITGFVRSLAVKGTDLFAGTANGVFRTTNNGTNWTATSLTHNMTSLCVVDTNLFGGTWAEGAYYMVNSNSTFKSMGLPSVYVTGFAADNGVLYASTSDNTVWKRSIAEILTGVKDARQAPVEFNLSQNYPNPFNPTTTINYSVAKSGSVELKVYNIMGKEVATLVNEQKGAGNYEVRFDASKLASGVYFYQLKSGDLILTKKLILMK